MPFGQPKVSPIASSLSLNGLVAAVTGATSGIGLETAKQLLQHKASTVILAVRNTIKGEQVKTQLLADPIVRRDNPSGRVELLTLDVSSDKSILSFASALKQQFPIINLLILNAGANTTAYTQASNGHELGLQVFYLSNALLIHLLLPHLESSTAKSNRVSRITWVGSRMAWASGHSLTTKPIGASENLIAHFDQESIYSMSTNYSDVKLLAYMYVKEAAARMDANKCVIDIFCPGLVDTNLTDYLPWYINLPVKLYKAIRARRLEVGGWITLHAAVVAGDREAHGTFYGDREPFTEPHEVADGPEGEKLKARLFRDSNAEVVKLAPLAKSLSS